MVTTDPRSDELLVDRIMRYGGRPSGADALEEWGLRDVCRRRTIRLSRREFDWAGAIVETRRPSISLAVLDLMLVEPTMTAAFVYTAGVFRDFLAAGFPVAGMHSTTLRAKLFVGWDDRHRLAVSTVGTTAIADLASHQLIALSENPGWYTAR
jgi:hypothetical protein